MNRTFTITTMALTCMAPFMVAGLLLLADALISEQPDAGVRPNSAILIMPTEPGQQTPTAFA